MDHLLSALLICGLRVCDVSLGTVRTMFTVQGKKYPASLIGLVEVTIWVVAIRQIFSHLDNLWNIVGYSSGFAIGTWLGITIEQTIGLGFTQMMVISLHHADAITDALRRSRFGVTLLPAEGGSGGTTVITSIIRRRRLKQFHEIVDAIDAGAFVSMQSADLHRGFVHGARK